MAIRGELYTTQIVLDNRSYFFNVKENRSGDVFLQIVESKKGEGVDFDRHQVAIFAEDMQKFLQGMEKSLDFVEKDRKQRQKAAREKKAAKEAKYGHGETANGKKIYRVKSEKTAAKADDGIKRTGKVIHIVSKKETEKTDN